MTEKGKKNQRFWLISLIAVCMGVILVGGIRYFIVLRHNLTEQSVQNVLAVTKQQQQALDNFISADRERLHSFADYFSRSDSGRASDIQRMLALFGEVDAYYSVIDLDTGHYYSNRSDEVYELQGEALEHYRGLSGSGVRDPYQSLYSVNTMFGYYECFTFRDGVRGLVQKSYDRTRVSDAFSLSFYNEEGFAYVVNREGKILLRSTGTSASAENIYDLFHRERDEQKEIDALLTALEGREAGSVTLAGDVICTYVPVENVEEWYLLSVVPEEAITAETNRILLDTQVALGFLALVLIVCAVFLQLIWHTNREIRDKEQEVEYQERLFDVFSTYLSRSTDDIYMMLDAASGRMEYVSPNVERVLGIPAGELSDGLDSLEKLNVSVEGNKIDFEALRTLEPDAEAVTAQSAWENPGIGEKKWFQQSVYCTQVQGVNKLVVYVSDRTRERETQDNLAQALQMAQAANQAKSAFLSNMSHDIRTPMNAIIGFLALLRDEADNPGMVLEYAQRIDAASQHLLGLINDVLDMNKIESGSATLNLTDMSLAEIIDEINSIIRPQVKAKKQIFDIFVSYMAYEHLMGDKLRINQILINLLSNAVKYTPEGGYIRLKVEELQQVVSNYSRIRFTISDNGLGMSEEYQKIIFDPFTREESEDVRRIQGTGLGMAITKSLVDLMGGTITVESRPGEGSTFTVELELFIQEQAEDPDFWTDHGVTKMIVVDDDEEACRNTVRLMSKTGVITKYATDGETAVRMVREAGEAGRPYDLILLDWKMPGLDGLETARLIRENGAEKIPILLLTAYDWGEIEQEAIEIGVDHFMPKPFFLSNFKAAIRRIMGSLKQAKDENNGVVKGKRILVVDDIEVNRIVLVKILTTMGADCDIAENGREAWEKFENSKPGEYDLILMDVQMPVMDGYAATRAIRGCSHPQAGMVPIVAMTANAFVEDIRNALDSGMDAHIAKPVQLDKLKSTIRQVFDSRKKTEST